MSEGIPSSHLFVGQVFHEDEDWITIKFGKRDDVRYELGQAASIDKFFTVVFVHRTEEADVIASWIPWEEEGYDD